MQATDIGYTTIATGAKLALRGQSCDLTTEDCSRSLALANLQTSI